MEEGLRSRVERLVAGFRSRERTIFDAALDCVIGMDASGLVVEWNRAAERTFGYAAAEARGRVLADLIVPPELRDAHTAGFRRVLETGERRIIGERVELVGLRRDGTRFPVELTVTQVEEAGAPHFVAYVRDITLRKLAEAELARSRDQLAVILSGIVEGVIAQDAEGRLVYANPAAAALMGMAEAEELLGDTAAGIAAEYELFDADGSPLPVANLPAQRALRGEAPSEMLVGFRANARSELRWSLVNATPLLDANGKVVLVVSIFRDVTERRREEEHQRFLVEAGAALFASMDFTERLVELPALVVPRLADWCAIDLVDGPQETRLIEIAHEDAEKTALARRLRDAYPPRTDDALYTVIRTGEAALYPHVTRDMVAASARDATERQLLTSLDLCSAMIVPLRARGRILGAVTLASAESRRVYTSTDLRRAEELARLAGTAIDNALLYEERSRIAETLQRTLLPRKLPAVPGVRLAARYHPTVERTEVGGDFYDAFPVGDASWLLVIGDVAGKGITAAAITGLARHTLKAAARHDPSPASILAHVADAITDELPPERFLTALCVVLEREERGWSARIASAGHPLPILLREDRSAARVGTPGTIITADQRLVATDTDVPLALGDRLVLFTDGVTEARSARGELFTDERLLALVTEVGACDADTIADAIDAAVREHQPNPQDDVALLVAEILAVAPGAVA